MVSKFCVIPPRQRKTEIVLELEYNKEVSRRMPSVFTMRALPSLFMLVFIQMSVLACVVGLEWYSCSLKNMLKLGCNALKYPHLSCGFQSLKCYSEIFSTWYALFAQISHVKIIYLSLLRLPNFFSSSNHLQLPRNQSSYLPEQFSINIRSTVGKGTLPQTHI